MTGPLTAPTWREVAEQQSGVLGRSQALLAGMTAHAWDWRRSRQEWSALLPGVALCHSGEPTDEQVCWAAVVHAGTGAAVTGDWALVQLGFRHPARGDRLVVAVPEGRTVERTVISTGSRTVDVVPRQVRGLEQLIHPVRRPPVVQLPVAALHAASVAPTDRGAEWRLAAVVQQRLTTAERLTESLAGMPRLKRRRLLSTVLDDVAHGVTAQSELAFVRLLRREGLPLPDRLQRPVRADGKRYLDAWWERQRLAAEIDGAHHIEVGQWDADVLRANAVVISELRDRMLLLRFTMGNLRHEEQRVVDQLRRVLLPEP